MPCPPAKVTPDFSPQPKTGAAAIILKRDILQQITYDGLMDAAHVIIRRATVDDLPQLIELWKLEQLPWESLEKRFTEFQVAADGHGTI